MTAHELAEQLRNAAAWLRLAADRLEDGKVEDARNMTALGMALCEPLPGSSRCTGHDRG